MRAHRAGIEHVRVVIACGSEADGGGACENDGDGPVEYSAAAEISSSMEGKSKDGGEATGIASAETERSLMELERHIQEMEENERAGVGSGRASDGLKYLVLFQLRSVGLSLRARLTAGELERVGGRLGRRRRCGGWRRRRRRALEAPVKAERARAD